MIEFSGVRSSWLIVARKSLLSRFISNRARFACASSSTLRSRSSLTSRSSCCMATRLWSIRLKACDELLELVAGLDLAADGQLAGGDRVGDVAEVLDRLDDHVADDRRTRRPSPGSPSPAPR